MIVHISLNYSTRTKRITLTNFGLSKHLLRDSELLTDQRGSLAYVSPDVLSGEFGLEYCSLSLMYYQR